MNFRATGTARKNRLKQCPLFETKLMEKKERGVYDVKCNKRIYISSEVA